MKRKKRIRPEQVIIFGFIGVILTGALLLMLPISRNQSVSFIDALFTATSATCVTGLVVQNTATFWSDFGHVIILALIQIGGLGVITVALLLYLIGGRKIGLGQRTLMQEAINAPRVGGIVRLTRFLIRGVLLIEALGALFLFIRFGKDQGVLRGAWFSIFHSISAFCNGGFDILSTPDMAGSLCSYAFDPLVNIVICSLIVIGGIGFLTWEDFVQYRFRFKKYSLQSKIVLVTTAILIILPIIFMMIFEFKDYSLSQKWWLSFFQSITLRTAGFNTVDFNEVSEPGLLIMILTMLVGGASGSTAGGMKVSTIALVVLSARSIFLRRKDVACFNRRVERETIMNALAIFIMYICIFLVGGIMISLIEGLPILTCLFESASAIATVGVTMGITSSLHTASKILIIIMMFLGRVGGLTFIYATLKGSLDYSRHPHEKVMVG